METPIPPPLSLRPWLVRAAVIVGTLVGAAALAVFAWWLPARAPSGYYLPDTRGVSSPAPAMVGVIWVRPWPWDTTPPPIRISLTLADGQTITDWLEIPSPVRLLSSRAQLLFPSFNPDSTFSRSGRITRVTVGWGTHTASRSLTHLWAVRATNTDQMSGFVPLVTSGRTPRGLSPTSSWPLVIMMPTPVGAVLRAAAADPASSPWMTPRCAWVGNVNRATEGSPRHLRHELRRFSRAACANPGLVLAGRPPRGYLVFTFQPIVVARMGGRLETLSSGVSEVGAVNVFTPFDWWRFVH